MKATTHLTEAPGAGHQAPHTGRQAGVLPEIRQPDSHTGVSTHYARPTSQKSERHWYALRSTYGQERKAYSFIVAHGGTAYHPTRTEVRERDGKKTEEEVSLIPNMLFACGTQEEVEAYVFDNVNLPYLRFYYDRHLSATDTPLIVPDAQMESLRIICSVPNADTLFYNEEINKFKAGMRVRVTTGPFRGVEGRIARFKGQQRVGVVIDGRITAVTAYVPGAWVEEITKRII